MAAILSGQSEKPNDGAVRSCPFCGKSGYKRHGNHLPRCPERNGNDYTFMLSQKTLNNKEVTAANLNFLLSAIRSLLDLILISRTAAVVDISLVQLASVPCQRRPLQ